MDLPPARLAALVAVVDTGTFEAAARALHVTPSAVSQRVRALESAVGRVLVRRGTPCRATPAGESLVRLGRQTRLLQEEVAAELGLGGPLELAVAVSADALATWWRPVLDEVAGWDGVALRLSVEDQAFSADLLRGGECLAAVTSDPVAVQGCSVEPLGALRYRPAATVALRDRWRTRRGGVDWAAMPVVVLDAKDALQADLLAHHGVSRPPVEHRVPTSADFHRAVRAGLGWGMLPDPQLDPDLASGDLVLLSRERADVALHWQRWRLASPVLDQLTSAVRRAAAAGLRAAGRG